MSSITSAVRAAGWRQGDIIDDTFSIKAVTESSCDFIGLKAKEIDFLLIITQSCDLVRSEDIEPYFDFITGRSITTPNGMLSHGKNPRQIQIPLNDKIAEFNIHNKFRIKKSDIIRINPKKSLLSLTKEDLLLIVRWISKRYSRPAFPDAFNERLRYAQKKRDVISKSPVLNQVSLILLDVNDMELHADENYSVQIIIGTKDKLSNDLRNKIDDLLYEAFTVPGIEITDLAIIPEEDITINTLRSFKRWDWDYRSLSDDDGEIIPPPADIDTI